jgi:hypothetical protein
MFVISLPNFKQEDLEVILSDRVAVLSYNTFVCKNWGCTLKSVGGARWKYWTAWQLRRDATIRQDSGGPHCGRKLISPSLISYSLCNDKGFNILLILVTAWFKIRMSLWPIGRKLCYYLSRLGHDVTFVTTGCPALHNNLLTLGFFSRLAIHMST